MFDLPISLRKKGLPHHVVWTYAFHPRDILKYVSKENILKIDLKQFCKEFESLLPTANRDEKELKQKYSVYLSANMLLGLCRVYFYHVNHLYSECELSLERVGHQDSLAPIEDVTPSPVDLTRQASPVDFDFDMEEPRFELNDDSRSRPFLDEDQAALLQSEAQDDNTLAIATLPQDGQSPARPPRKRAAKRGIRAADSDDDDDNQGKKRRARRKVTRKAAVASVARHEDITLRDVAPLRDVLEQDLENDLEPLDEDVLNDGSAPVNAPFDDAPDFDYPEHIREPTPPRLMGVDDLRSPSASHAASALLGIDNLEAASTLQAPPNLVGIDHLETATAPHASSRSASPSHLIGIDVLRLHSSSVSHVPSRQGSVVPPGDDVSYHVSHIGQDLENNLDQDMNDGTDGNAPTIPPYNDAGDFDYQESIRSASPSRLIGIDILRLRSASTSHAPSRQGSVVPPGDDITYVAHSRSVTPGGSRAGSIAPRPKKGRTPKKPKTFARENPIILENDVIRNRDDVYCQKDLFDMKIAKIKDHIDGAHDVYKKFFGDDVEIEVNDMLRDQFRNLSMDAEHPRRRNTRDRSSVRPASRITDVTSLRSPQRTVNLTDTAPGDIFDQDFDYDLRPATPRPQTPVRQLSKSPSRQIRQPGGASPSYGDIEYFEPEPLPQGMEHLMSPIRPVPAEFLSTTAEQSPVRELACTYGHDELYMLILNLCVKEKKVVFKFKEFAQKWPRHFISKQFHNFLLLIQMRKILARCKNGIFHSFIVIPNEVCLAQVIKCDFHHRNAAVPIEV